jgi:lipopolysaccharide export LptBFGC system permease protein LptF
MNMMNMDFTSPAVMIGAVVAVLLIATAIAVVAIQQKKKSALLRTRFGPEYELAVREAGSRKKGEEALHARVKRVEQLKIRDLTVAERDRYLREWEAVQLHFIAVGR